MVGSCADACVNPRLLGLAAIVGSDSTHLPALLQGQAERKGNTAKEWKNTCPCLSFFHLEHLN